ncbi:hypothetical protein GCK72_003260 [Caenorhabditis remanei]|uniref:Uncharacterized protein n=1 Tax=Caenorhabditis remanei TaxID=31234 RepID=A0A6A5HX11_CAERE|nr:hypothetical protein GCK72_003260 [Caenorhabditis remanei]KAF1771434.1 hypothetical protein GCK72_003260 [Caenorhabditis remanei]
MSFSKPFPLLRLPRLPLLEVFDCMGVQEQFYLSICSSKAKYSIKFYTSIRKFSVTFYFTNNFTFFLKAENSDDKFQIHVQTDTVIFGSIWRFLSSVDVSGTPLEKNVKRLLLFLLDVFNTPTICLGFEVTRHDFVTGFINYIHSLKLKINSLNIKGIKEEDVEHILDNYRDVSSKIYLDCPTIPGIKYLNKSSKPSLNKVTIVHAEWVTTYHLTILFINCKRLVLDNLSTDYIKVDLFLKEWRKGSSPLKYACLALTFVDPHLINVLEGIRSKRVSTRGTRWARYARRAIRIKQRKTGARAYVIQYDRTILITDSLQ